MANYHYVYVLMSQKDGNFYVGYTKNVQKCLEQHNNGRVSSTKDRRPMKLFYWEGSISQQDATKREKYLKTAWGKRYIKGRVKDYLISDNPDAPQDGNTEVIIAKNRCGPTGIAELIFLDEKVTFGDKARL